MSLLAMLQIILIKKGFHYRQPNEKKDKENIGIMGRKE